MNGRSSALNLTRNNIKFMFADFYATTQVLLDETDGQQPTGARCGQISTWKEVGERENNSDWQPNSPQSTTMCPAVASSGVGLVGGFKD